MQEFDSLDTLRSRAIACVYNFNMRILKNAATPQRSALAEIPRDALGAIGRNAQLEAIRNRRGALNLSDAPAMCFVVHGNEDAGQFNFLQFLAAWSDWKLKEKRARIVTPPHDEFDEISLCAAVAVAVNPGSATPSVDFEQLARAILDECSRKPVVLLLPRSYSGGLEAFQTRFWQPLMVQLLNHSPSPAPRNRLVVVVTCYAPLVPTASVRVIHTRPGNDKSEYGALFALPELASFTEEDVAIWLEDQGVDDSTRLASIVSRVTKDGVPRNVFDRLQADGFWSTIGQ